MEVVEEKKKKGKNHYGSGRGLEYETRNLLESWNYRVIRSAASKTAVDLIASKYAFIDGVIWRRVLVFQCKKGSSSFDEIDKEAFMRWAESFNAIPILVEKKDGKAGWKVIGVSEDELKQDFFGRLIKGA